MANQKNGQPKKRLTKKTADQKNSKNDGEGGTQAHWAPWLCSILLAAQEEHSKGIKPKIYFLEKIT